jgi:hyperosmotically inducible periplasmic protein
MGAAAGKVDDATITANVNARLVKDKDLSGIRIDVDTQDGVVTLSGLAPSASAKEHASEVAHKVAGVHSVNNQLTIKSS